MSLTLRVVDAFTDQPFTGNPAAVAVVDRFPDEGYMQVVAREMNLAETAFVVARPDGDHDLRWFTPTTEVDLCGHATLAAAHLLGGSARFHTRSGPLICRLGDEDFIEMDFPADVATQSDAPSFLGLSGVRWYGRGRFDALIELSGRPGAKLRSALHSAGYCLEAIVGQTTIWVPRRCMRQVVGGHGALERRAYSADNGSRR